MKKIKDSIDWSIYKKGYVFTVVYEGEKQLLEVERVYRRNSKMFLKCKRIRGAA